MAKRYSVIASTYSLELGNVGGDETRDECAETLWSWERE